MHHRTQHHPHRIGKDVFPAPVVALGAIVMHLLGYCHHHRHDGADDRKDKANTEVQCLVLACPFVVTVVHCLFCKVTELDYKIFHSDVAWYSSSTLADKAPTIWK